MRSLVAVLLLAISSDGLSDDERCPMKSLSRKPYGDVECLFYLGTTAYRAGFLEIAAAHWTALADRDFDGSDNDELVLAATANLGFFLYFDIPAEKQPEKAMELWRRAAQHGELSAMSYLGFAYSDADYAEQNNVIAFAWYQALIDNSDKKTKHPETVDQMRLHAEEQIRVLSQSLTPDEIVEATELAKSLLGD